MCNLTARQPGKGLIKIDLRLTLLISTDSCLQIARMWLRATCVSARSVIALRLIRRASVGAEQDARNNWSTGQ